ncbi:MAG: DUF1330 domain-containing protein [Alphaproteobacteria bacterium]|nr:DUF1330 domain-containing protein [Alphaproteobacteria bacterium]
MIAKYGGRVVARGAIVEVLEGQGDVSSRDLLQFPSIAVVGSWF